MFVQSARFVAEHKKNPSSELSIHGKALLEGFRQEVQKIQSVRKQLGLNGSSSASNKASVEVEWPAGYADVALEIYGEGMPLPRRFADLAPSVRARIQAKAAQNFNETERSLNTGK